jgi:hypothetical protein
MAFGPGASFSLLGLLFGLLTTVITDSGTIPIISLLNPRTEAAAAQTKPVILTNVAHCVTRLNGLIDSARGFRKNSILAVTGLNGGGSIIGLMERINNLHGRFAQNDQKLLELFAFVSEFEKTSFESPSRNRIG